MWCNVVLKRRVFNGIVRVLLTRLFTILSRFSAVAIPVITNYFPIFHFGGNPVAISDRYFRDDSCPRDFSIEHLCAILRLSARRELTKIFEGQTNERSEIP